MSVSNTLFENVFSNDRRSASRAAEFIWQPGYVGPYESLWIILKKFAYLNYASANEIKYLFANDKKEQPFPWYRESTEPYSWSFNGLKHLSAIKLNHVLRIPFRYIRYAVSPTYEIPLYTPYRNRRRQTIPARPFTDLHYCPECIETGFHTALFQFGWLRLCPLHKLPLVSTCPSCNKPITYKIIPKAFVNPLGCECGYELWHGKHEMLGSNVDNREIEIYLDNYLRWRSNLLNSTSFRLKQSCFRGRATFGRPDYIQELATVHLWEEIAQIEKPWPRNAFFSVPESQVVHTEYKSKGTLHFSGLSKAERDQYRSRLVEIKTISEVLLQNNYTGDYLAVYKSCKRHLINSVLKDHKMCIRDALYTAVVNSAERMPIPCEIGFALVLWTEFWEENLLKVCYYKHIFQPPLRKPIVTSILRTRMRFINDMEILLDGYWKILGQQSVYRNKFMKWLTLKILGIILLSTFEEAIKLARHSKNISKTLLSESGIQENSNPVFCLYDPPRKGVYILYWSTTPNIKKLQERSEKVTPEHRIEVRVASNLAGRRAGRHIVMQRSRQA